MIKSYLQYVFYPGVGGLCPSSARRWLNLIPGPIAALCLMPASSQMFPRYSPHSLSGPGGEILHGWFSGASLKLFNSCFTHKTFIDNRYVQINDSCASICRVSNPASQLSIVGITLISLKVRAKEKQYQKMTFLFLFK